MRLRKILAVVSSAFEVGLAIVALIQTVTDPDGDEDEKE